MQRVITGKYFSIQYITLYRYSFQLGYTHDRFICIPLIFGFDMISLKQRKNNIQSSSLESVLLSNAKWDTVIPSKVFISFVELSVLYYLRYV